MGNRHINNYQDASILTPLRRPDITRNTRFSYIESEKEWTAARCQRLLRTLTSRVATLRKEICRYGKIQPPEIGPRTAHSSPQSSTPNKNYSTDWTKKKKKLKRTYSRLKNPQQSSIKNALTPDISRKKGLLLPGEFSIPTPVLARVRDDQYTEQNPSITTNLDENRDEIWSGRRRSRNCFFSEYRQSHLFGSIHDLRQSISTAQNSRLDGIYNGLEILLHTTSEVQTPIKIKGTRSLLETALRTVPRYITDQQKLLQIHLRETGCKSAIQDRDISREIYDELENFGSCRNGWKRLRNVVRAHGMLVVTDAIEEGLLNFEICSTLVSLCIHIGAKEEAQLILSSLLSSTAFSPPETPSHIPCKPICLLQKFTKQTNQTTFFYRELSKLISKRILPFEWLATKELGHAWTGLMQSLAPESLDYEASTFLDIAFSWFLKIPDQSHPCKNINNSKLKHDCLAIEIRDAVKNTFSSVLTILLSIVILVGNSEPESNITKNPSFGRFDYIVSFLGRFLNYLPANKLENEQHLLLLIANIIIHKEHIKLKSEISILRNLHGRLRSTHDKNTKLPQVADFVCQVARCCGRGTSGLGFDYLKIIHLRLKALDFELDVTSFLKGVIVDSASVFARKVPHYQHVEYAASMDATYFTRANNTLNCQIFPLNNLMEKNVSGFRWEEGIGEWVTTTPLTNKLKRKAIQPSEEFGLSTMSPKPSKIRRKLMDSVSVVIQTKNFDGAQKMNRINENCSEMSNISSKKLPADGVLPVSVYPSKNENKSWGRLQKQNFVKNELFGQEFVPDNNQTVNQEYIDLQELRPGEISEGYTQNDKHVNFDKNLSRYQGSLTFGIPDSHTEKISTPSINLSFNTEPQSNVRKPTSDSPSSSSLSFSSGMESPSDNRLCENNHAGNSGQTWELISLGDDEDELSHISFTSIRNKKRISGNRNSRMKSNVNYTSSNAKMCVVRRARPSTNIGMRIEDMKKCFLTRRRTRSTSSGYDKEWSEDELCS